jgi:simple sugar transport system ATP-binding protein
MARPDAGEILIGGRTVTVESPRDAMAQGVGMVFQHFMLIPVMTVAENLVLGAEPRRRGLLDIAAARERCRELSERHGLRVDPDARIADVSVGQQQRVEILRALDRGAQILVLDEPTAVLTAQETAELAAVLRNLRDAGTSIVFITHKLHEVLEIADRVTVLRRGKVVGTVDTAGADEASLARMMVGRDVVLRVEKEPAKPREPVLEVEDLRAVDDRGLPAVDGISLQVRAGEIVAVAGIDGNGQGELIDTISGLRHVASGPRHHGLGPAQGARGRGRPHPRGPPPPGPGPGLHPGREPGAARLPPGDAVRAAVATADAGPRPGAARGVRRARG